MIKTIEMSLKELYPWDWKKFSNVYIKGNKIIADESSEIEAYSPFDYFGDESNKENIITALIKVDVENNDSIIEFVKNFGFLQYQNVSPYFESVDSFKFEYKKFKLIALIYSFINDLLNEKKDNKEEKSDEEIKEDIKRYLESQDTKVLSISAKIHKELILNSANLKEMKYQLMSIIVTQINNETKKIVNHLAINSEDLTVENRAIAPDLITVLYFMLHLSLIGKRILRRCQNHPCDKYFYIYKNNTRKIFCSHVCAVRKNTYTYRKNHKDDINKKRKAYRKLEK